MSDEPASAHPVELLSGYVDGSATAADRAAVDLHLASCERCRREVVAATEGLAALRSLGQVEGAEMVGRVLAALPVERTDAGVSATADLATARARRASRITGRAWALGGGVVAAAAVVVVLFVSLGGPSSVSTSTAPAASPTAAGLRILDRGASYSAATLASLAKNLAAQRSPGFDQALGPAGPAPASKQAGGVPSASSGSSAAAGTNPAAAAQACLRQGGAPAGVPIYLEAATFDATPVYVGAFVQAGPWGQPPRLSLIAVRRTGCQPVFFTSAKQPP